MDFQDDTQTNSNGLGGLQVVDTSVLRVVRASDAELADHETYLELLDKAVKGECLWRTVESADHAVAAE